MLAVGEEPSGPRRRVDHERQDDEQRARRDLVEHEGTTERVPRPGDATRAGIPEEHQHEKHRQPEDPAPLGRHGESEADGGADAPRPHSEPRAEVVADWSLDPRGQPSPTVVAVENQASERRQHPEHQEDVEHRDPALDELEPVERDEQRGDTSEEGRTEEPPPYPRDEKDREAADDGGGEPPPE